MDTVSLESSYRRNGDLVSSDLDGEIVLLSIRLGEYIHMNETATRVWDLLEEPVSGHQICKVLQAEYAIDAETCAAAVERLLGELLEKRLIEVS